MSSQKKRRKLEKNSNASSALAKTVRLTNVNVSNLMVKRGIKTEDELLSLAWAGTKDCEPALQSFVLNKTPKARDDLTATTWRMQRASQLLERSHKTRIQIISEALKTEYAGAC